MPPSTRPICLTAQRVSPTAEGVPYAYHFDQDEVLIGRAEGVEVRLPDPAVSLVHLRLLRKRGQILALDPGSTNGTWLEGVRLVANRPTVVATGQRLHLGPFELELRSALDRPATAPKDTASFARQMVAEVLGVLGAPERPPYLEVLGGPQRGQRLEVTSGSAPLVLGRDEGCDFRLSDADASRQHVEVARQGAEVFARDLGSKNGLLVNGHRAEGRRALRHGDRLQVGQTLLRFVDPTEEYLEGLAADEDAARAAVGETPSPPDLGESLAPSAVPAASVAAGEGGEPSPPVQANGGGVVLPPSVGQRLARPDEPVREARGPRRDWALVLAGAVLVVAAAAAILYLVW
ncbi:MAG: FHA domain-containing protein [Deltaproteobacteria bacterium]|nr:FHA domain-containing protein [Deltaproteobacteria bacterium]